MEITTDQQTGRPIFTRKDAYLSPSTDVYLEKGTDLRPFQGSFPLGQPIPIAVRIAGQDLDRMFWVMWIIEPDWDPNQAAKGQSESELYKVVCGKEFSFCRKVVPTDAELRGDELIFRYSFPPRKKGVHTVELRNCNITPPMRKYFFEVQ